MCFTETGLYGADWVYLTRGMDEWRAFVDAVMSL